MQLCAQLLSGLLVLVSWALVLRAAVEAANQAKS